MTANWTCEACGKVGTPSAGHVLVTRGSLRTGDLSAHTFCRKHDPLKARAK